MAGLMEYAKGTPRSVTVTEGKTRTFTAGPPLATTRTGELPEIGKCFQEKQIRCILRREGAPPDISRGDRGGRRGYCFRRAYRRICLLSRKRSVDSEFLCRHGRYTSKTLSVKRLSSQRTRRPPREAEFGLRVAGAGSAFFGENLLLFSFRMGQLGVYWKVDMGIQFSMPRGVSAREPRRRTALEESAARVAHSCAAGRSAVFLETA